MVTCLDDGGEGNYLIKINLREVFRWLSSTQMKLQEDELGLWKVWVEVSEGFWVVLWDWNALKLKKWNFVLGVSTQMCSKGLEFFKRGKWRGYLPLFIEKVCGWFGGKGMKVCFRLVSGSMHAWGWTMGDKCGCCMSLLTPHTTLS